MGSAANYVLASVPLLPSVYFATLLTGAKRRQVLYAAALAAVGLWVTLRTIPLVRSKILARTAMGLTGKDLCKKGTPAGDAPIPESLGMVSGTVLVICMIFCQVYYTTTQQGQAEYASATLCICFMLFLGLTDDILDLPWRVKFIIPTIACLPLLCSYTGGTSVVLPAFVRPLIASAAGEPTALGGLLNLAFTVDPMSAGAVVDLGYFYMLYMGLLSVFCTNAINIYAGINGLEAGQSFVIGAGILAHNLLELSRDAGPATDHRHLFSALVMLPFIATTLGLLWHNWYPSRVFVGDTFCYYAGMTFAVVGILGHFSKTLLLFFLPQVANFVLSLPQLAKIVPCPRHRLPAFNAKTGLLEPSRVPADPAKPSANRAEGGCPNLTVMNLSLVVFGPMRERTLCVLLMFYQVACCALVFVIRYPLAEQFYGDDLKK